jgi:hypothetical protein
MMSASLVPLITSLPLVPDNAAEIVIAFKARFVSIPSPRSGDLCLEIFMEPSID